jgi:outer membrane protein assembly factor BamB
MPEPLRPLVLRGMTKDPGRRLWDAGEFVTTLEETAVRAYGPDWERRGWAVLGAAAAAFAAAFPLAVIGSSAVTGIKGIIAKITGARAATAVGGGAAIAIAVYLLWPSPPYRDAWNTDQILPAGTIRPVAGGFTFFGRTKAGTYELTTVNARTGKVRWRHPASESLPLGQERGPVVVGRTAVFTQMVNESRFTQQVVAVDVATGRVRWIHGRGGLSLFWAPEACGATTVCVSLHDTTTPPHTSTQRVRILDVGTGRQLSQSPPLDAVKLAPGLYDSVDHRQLVRTTTDGRQLWRRPIEAIFGDVNPLEVNVIPTTRAGRKWQTIGLNDNWDIQLGDGRYVGEIGGRGKLSVAKRLRYLDYAAVGAFDAATGRRLWAARGATVFCGHLEFTLDHPVRCRKTGQVDLSPGAPDKWRLNDVNVTVEGFDPATGRTRWSWQAGSVRGLAIDYGDDHSVIRLDDTTYLVKAPAGTVLLDLDSGPRQVGGPLPTGWCFGETAATPKQTGYSYYWEGPLTRLSPCDAAGKETKLPANTPAFAGARTGDIFAWPGGKGLRAVIID